LIHRFFVLEPVDIVIYITNTLPIVSKFLFSVLAPVKVPIPA
jgi:hypothetical protein